MIERAYIHVGGPAGAGKTTLIEALLAHVDGPVLVTRCVRQPDLRAAVESTPARDAELLRYRRAGASGVARFQFGESTAHDEFFMTELMTDYSVAVLVEGDSPFVSVDLEIFVAPVLEGRRLLVRRARTTRAETTRKGRDMEALLKRPDGVAALVEELTGVQLGEFLSGRTGLVEETRKRMLEAIATGGRAPAGPQVKRWIVADPYAGIEHAGLVVFNRHTAAEQRDAGRLLAELDRLRGEDDVFQDVLSWRGSRTPITAVSANLSDAADPGTRKAVARIKRTITARSGASGR